MTICAILTSSCLDRHSPHSKVSRSYFLLNAKRSLSSMVCMPLLDAAAPEAMSQQCSEPTRALLLWIPAYSIVYSFLVFCVTSFVITRLTRDCRRRFQARAVPSGRLSNGASKSSIFDETVSSEHWQVRQDLPWYPQRYLYSLRTGPTSKSHCYLIVFLLFPQTSGLQRYR